MNNRQIVLDTETTGLKVEEGHRIIEIAAIELINRKITGRTLHFYLNPQRSIDAGALAIHGMTEEFLSDKSLFSELADHILDFITGAELIIHNAPFDLGFLNYEYSLCRSDFSIQQYCQVIDTLQLARSRHMGQRNNLDALCKRYGIDNSKREFHGALLDVHLLAQVYLAMTGGQGSFFDNQMSKADNFQKNIKDAEIVQLPKSTPIVFADANELQEHESYLNLLEKEGQCVWREV